MIVPGPLLVGVFDFITLFLTGTLLCWTSLIDIDKRRLGECGMGGFSFGSHVVAVNLDQISKGI
jgi:hypothetical protein